jgi:hypothetical protein
MKRATFFGELRRENGKAVLIIPDKGNVAQIAWETFGRCLVRIDIVEDDPGKSIGLQRYFRKFVLPDITKAFNELGNRWSNDRAYEELKEQMEVPFIEGKRSTKRMTRNEYRQFVDECIQFANEFLQIEIREPKRAGGFPNEER